MLLPQQERLDADGVFAKFGVHPKQMVEYLMLIGDKIDNIPGVKGVGPVTAAKVLADYKSISKVKTAQLKPALQRNWKAGSGFFELSRKLITLDTSAIITSEQKLSFKEPSEFEQIASQLDCTSVVKGALDALEGRCS